MSRYLVTIGAGTGAGKVIQSCATTVTINKKPSCKMKKTMIIFVSVLLALLLPSCSGQSPQLKEFVKDAIASALDDTPKPPKRYTTEELKAMGVNTEHLFEFTDTTMTYNGTPFMLGETIERMVEIFGPYDRKVRNVGNLYFWDEIGIFITTYSVENPQTNKTNNFHIDWNLDMSGHDYPTISRDELELREIMITNTPKKFFQGKILVHGIPLGRGMSIESFLDKTDIFWSNEPFPVLFRRELYDLDYQKIDISSYEVIQYIIRVSKDFSDIESFAAASVPR